MNDAAHLTTLLDHLPPEVFGYFVSHEFDTELPPFVEHLSRKQLRDGFYQALSALDPRLRQQMDEVAERILLLSDCAGQDVLDGITYDFFDTDYRQTVLSISDQYQRSLFLYQRERAVFEEALNIRQADIFRKNAECYSGFSILKHLSVLDDLLTRTQFQNAVASQLGCHPSQVAIQIFKRLRMDENTGEDVELVQISILHNGRQMLVDRVLDGEIRHYPMIRAEASHITYEPSLGHLEVLSRAFVNREAFARLVTKILMQSDFTSDELSLKQYDYQSLSCPRVLDISGENILYAKVIELGYSDTANRTFTIKINIRDYDDIYTAAKSLINPSFSFTHHPLNYVKLAIRLKKMDREKERTISIVLRGANECNVKSKHVGDRALCDRLLQKWNLIKDSTDYETTTPDVDAA